jgi:hypothetical protein
MPSWNGSAPMNLTLQTLHAALPGIHHVGYKRSGAAN